MALENTFQSDLLRELREMFPEAIILKNDANYLQGIPDILILFKDTWALLETKKSIGARHRPNQDYYIDKASTMSYASFICPENKERILNELQQTFGSRRSTRFSRRK